MRRLIIAATAAFLLLFALSVLAQTPSRSRPVHKTGSAEAQPTPPESPEVDTVKVETNLVTVPVIATDVGGVLVPDLRQDEFSIFEDNVKQNIAFFATVSTPFHVILMIDTSASTEDKLRQIQEAALAFVDQLKPADPVKVISFDNDVRDLNEFTSDHEALRTAILKTRSGAGTKLYDAVELALNSVRRIEGRKAIVLFTDGVDYHSDEATFDGTLRGLDEEGVIVYPIRFDTRAATERIAREQAQDQLPTIGVIRTPAPGTTAPTFPSDDPIPTKGKRIGLPSPADVLRGTRRREDPRDRAPDRVPENEPLPPSSTGRTPTGPFPDPNDPRNTGSRRRTESRADDSIGTMLDGLYLTADSYLEKLATQSGGRLVRADTVKSLPAAFALIASELRTQYSLGYYPTNTAHDGQYRKVKVSLSRKAVTVRARPGYRAAAN